MVTVRASPSLAIAIRTENGFLPGAVAWTWCSPPSTGIGVDQAPRPSSCPSRSTRSPATSAWGGTTMVNRDRRGSSARRRALASSSRSRRPSRPAATAASLNSLHERASRPSTS
jgi:hypothetical protein